MKVSFSSQNSFMQGVFGSIEHARDSSTCQITAMSRACPNLSLCGVYIFSFAKFLLSFNFRSKEKLPKIGGTRIPEYLAPGFPKYCNFATFAIFFSLYISDLFFPSGYLFYFCLSCLRVGHKLNLQLALNTSMCVFPKNEDILLHNHNINLKNRNLAFMQC